MKFEITDRDNAHNPLLNKIYEINTFEEFLKFVDDNYENLWRFSIQNNQQDIVTLHVFSERDEW